MRGFYKLPQGLKLGKNSDGKVKYAQIRIFKDSQLWKQNLWGACPHLSSSQGHSEDWRLREQWRSCEGHVFAAW